VPVFLTEDGDPTKALAVKRASDGGVAEDDAADRPGVTGPDERCAPDWLA